MCSNFPKTFPKPLPTPFSALIVGLVVCFLSSASSLAIAGNLADAERLMKQGNLSQALQVVDAHIANRPRALQERFLKGLILAEMGRPTEAIAVFKALSEEFPELPEPYNNLAVLYAQQKQYDQALAVLEMAIRTHPGYAMKPILPWCCGRSPVAVAALVESTIANTRAGNGRGLPAHQAVDDHRRPHRGAGGQGGRPRQRRASC
jgi:tetratricopeptide (TPR) repeat protein